MLSVITVCLNCKNDIEKTMISVLSQKDADIEYIIKDGGSDDGTNEIIERVLSDAPNDRIKAVHVCEPDEGIYDAMNKASELATGDHVIFMNAGDVFYDEFVVRDAGLYFDGGADILFGNTLYTMPLCFFPQLHFADRDRNTLSIGHQSCIYSSKILEKYRFDTKYKIAADHDQLQKIFRDGNSFTHMNLFVSICNREGVSNQRSTAHFDEVYMIGHDGRLEKDGRYFMALLSWKVRTAMAKMFPMLENKRYCLNNLKRNQFALPKNFSSSIKHRQ